MARDRRPSKTFSARFDVAVVDRLAAFSERIGQSNARVAQRYIDEGLRMDEFPGIVFRPGSTGRRAGLAGGPDVWEIVRDLKAAAAEGVDDPIAAVCAGTGLARSKVELALAYYGSYPEDVDERIAMNEEAVERLRRVLAGPAAEA